MVLYTEQTAQQEYVEVPDMRGYTVNDANYIMSGAGLNFVAEGASTDTGNAVVLTQSQAPGTSVPRGTVIELTFGVNDQSG